MQPKPAALERMKRKLTELLAKLGDTENELRRLENERDDKQNVIRQQRDKELADITAQYAPQIAAATTQRDAAKRALLKLLPSQLRWFYKPHTTTAPFDTGEIQYNEGKSSMVVDDEDALRASLRRRKVYRRFTKDAPRPLNTATLKSALLKGDPDVRNLPGVRITRHPLFYFRPNKTQASANLSAEAPNTPEED